MLVAGLIPIRARSAENYPGKQISCGSVLVSSGEGPDDACEDKITRRMGRMALLLLVTVLSALTGGVVLAVSRGNER